MSPSLSPPARVRGNPAAVAAALFLAAAAGCAAPDEKAPPAAAEEALPRGPENALDRENGFRRMEFGIPLSAVRDRLSYVSHKDKWQYFTRKGEEMKLGDAEPMAIYYSFHRSRLAQVTIVCRGEANGESLLAWMRSSYGPGDGAPGGAKLVWNGALTVAVYDRNPVTGVSVASLYSRRHVPAKR